MAIKLKRINKTNLLNSLDWREEELSGLRTSQFILDIEQEKFYESLHKRKDIILFSIVKEGKCGDDLANMQHPGVIGIGGFVNINQSNRNAEISLIVNPIHRTLGYGNACLRVLLNYAFNIMNIKNVYGEVYFSNKHFPFWKKFIDKYNLFSTTLPERKYFNGTYYDSLYFNVKNGDL